MLNLIDDTISAQGRALVLRSERQKILSSNIANADTPGYVARDLKFSEALQQAQSSPGHAPRLATTSGAHLSLAGTPATGDLVYATPSQARLDGNTVDLDRERASFVDNTVRYEATLRFVNQQTRTLLTAITGQ